MIDALTVAIGLIGLGLFVVLAVGIVRVSKIATLRQYRSKDAGVADLLQYALPLEDGIILCKSGAFMAAWMYAGNDQTNLTNEEKEHTASLINAALRDLGNGYMLHIDAVRRAVPSYIERGLSHFPDEVSKAIDEERRRFFESHGTMYEGYYVLTLTWFPPVLAQTKFVELMFDDDAEPQIETGRLEKLLSHFKKDISMLENNLSCALHLERLKAHPHTQEDGSIRYYHDFLSHLQFCITGITQSIEVPTSMNTYLDAILGGQEFHSGTIPKIGHNFIQAVSIEGFPLASYPGMLETLNDMDVEYRWSNRFIFLDKHTAVSHINRFRKKWKQLERGIIDVIFQTHNNINADAVAMTEDAQDAITEVQSGLVGAGYYTSTVILMHHDRTHLAHAALKLQQAIFNLNFATRVETINTIEAWLGSLPGHGVENVRRPCINTLNFADMIPLSTIWTGNKMAPCPLYPPASPALMYGVTTGFSPFRINLHVRDVGHTILFGSTGAGKSTALATIIMQFRRYQGMKIFAFDKGMSLYAPTRACGGKHFVINGDTNSLQFAPLQYLETPADRSWAKEWINSILALNNVHTSVEQRTKIGRALEQMAASPEGRSLSDFTFHVQDTQISACLEEGYTLSGTIGALLDAKEDNLTMASFMTFELEMLMGLQDKFVLPVLLYLFRRIESALDGSPAIIVLDEAWLMLGHPVFAAKIVEWLRVLRKANCAVIMATQNLADAAKSSIFPIIVENTATKIFLPNPFARNEGIAPIYTRMGLNSKQIDIIATATPKHHYYLVSELGSRLFSLNLQPLALSFVAASDKESIHYIQKLESMYGDQWVDHWLATKKLALADYQSQEVV